MEQTIYVELQLENAKDAVVFYQEALDFKVTGTGISYGKDMPQGDMPDHIFNAFKDKIIHAEFTFKDNIIFIADAMDMSGNINTSCKEMYTVCLGCDSEAEIDEMFAKLADKGEILMPLARQFWNAKYGIIRDRFGVKWALNYDYPNN